MKSEAKREKEILERRARLYYLVNGASYRKMFLPVDAKFFSITEGILVLREAHEGGCAEHIGFGSLARKVARAGFYWPTMRKDAEEMVKKCPSCQKHGQKIHIPAIEMIAISSPCRFARWGVDIVGPFVKAKEGKQFLVIAVDYFTKWVEAEPFSKSC